MQLRWLCVAALLVMGCSGSPRPSATPSVSPTSRPQARWTLMFYCDADNDLEAAELKNLQDIARIGSTPEINVVTLVDRAESGTLAEGYSDEPLNNLANWSTAKLLLIEQGRFEELADWGEINMASGTVLARFLQDCLERYPAQHFALIMLDHGDAWAGVCGDDTAPEPDDLLRPQELNEALQQAGFGPQRKLDVLVFDACLMANLEVLTTIRERVRLVVASEEIIPETGLRYSNSLAELQRGRWGKEDEALGWSKDLVKRNQPSLNDELTHLALLRLDLLPGLEQNIEDLARELLARLRANPKDTWLKLARCRARSQEFGRSDMPLVPNAEVRDVVDLCRYLGQSFPDLAPLCLKVKTAVGQVRLSQVRSDVLPHAQGLTLFFPPQKESAQEIASADYFKLVPSQLKNWALLLRAYTQMERDDASRPVLEKIKATSEEWSPGEVVEIQSRLSRPDELDTCHFLIAQNDLILCSLPSYPEEDSTIIKDEFDGSALVIAEKFGSNGRLWCPLPGLTEAPGGNRHNDWMVSSVPGQMQRKGGREWSDISLVFRFDLSQETLRGELMRVVRNTNHGPATLTLKRGDSIRLLYESLSAGQVSPRLVAGKVLVLEHPDQLIVRPFNLPAGEYKLGFRIHDFSGRTALETFPLTVHRN